MKVRGEDGAIAVVAAEVASAGSSDAAQHAHREARQPPSACGAACWQDHIANSISAQQQCDRVGERDDGAERELYGRVGRDHHFARNKGHDPRCTLAHLFSIFELF